MTPGKERYVTHRHKGDRFEKCTLRGGKMVGLREKVEYSIAEQYVMRRSPFRKRVNQKKVSNSKRDAIPLYSNN